MNADDFLDSGAATTATATAPAPRLKVSADDFLDTATPKADDFLDASPSIPQREIYQVLAPPKRQPVMVQQDGQSFVGEIPPELQPKPQPVGPTVALAPDIQARIDRIIPPSPAVEPPPPVGPLLVKAPEPISAQQKIRRQISPEKGYDYLTTPLWDYLPERLRNQLDPGAFADQVARKNPDDKFMQTVDGVINGVGGFAKAMTEPDMIAMMGMGDLPPAARKLVALGFAVQMASQTPAIATELGTEMGKAPDQRDHAKIARLITEGGLNTGFAAMAGAHGLLPEAKPVGPDWRGMTAAQKGAYGGEQLNRLLTGKTPLPEAPASPALDLTKADDFLQQRQVGDLNTQPQAPAPRPAPAAPPAAVQTPPPDFKLSQDEAEAQGPAAVQAIMTKFGITRDQAVAVQAQNRTWLGITKIVAQPTATPGAPVTISQKMLADLRDQIQENQVKTSETPASAPPPQVPPAQNEPFQASPAPASPAGEALPTAKTVLENPLDPDLPKTLLSLPDEELTKLAQTAQKGQFPMSVLATKWAMAHPETDIAGMEALQKQMGQRGPTAAVFAQWYGDAIHALKMDEIGKMNFDTIQQQEPDYFAAAVKKNEQKHGQVKTDQLNQNVQKPGILNQDEQSEHDALEKVQETTGLSKGQQARLSELKAKGTAGAPASLEAAGSVPGSKAEAGVAPAPAGKANLPEPGAPVKPAKVRRTFYLRPRSDGVHDILDDIQELGGIKPPGKNAGGEYDGYKEATKGAAALLRSQTGESVDNLIKGLHEKGYHRIQSADDVWNAVKQASESRDNLRIKGGGPEAQTERFWSAATSPNSKAGLIKISAADLNVGMKFRLRAPGVSHEELTVTHVDPDTDTVTVKDGTSFGTQDLPDGTEIWVQKTHFEAQKKAPAAKFSAGEEIAKGLYARIGRTLYPISTFGDASKKFEQARNKIFNEGGSSEDIPQVDIVDSNGKQFGYVSQNGRVWKGTRENWKQNEVVYEPRSRTEPGAASRRDFPAFTLEQLKHSLPHETDAAMRQRLTAEIAARESGEAKPKVTPQIKGEPPKPVLKQADDLFGAPESVGEQRARLEKEQLARDEKKAKEQMLTKAGARLTGEDIDATGEMFGGEAQTRADKAGQQSFFAKEEKPGRGITPDQAQRVSDAMTQNFKNAPPTEIHGTPETLPAPIRRAAKQQGVNLNTVKAVYHDGKVHLVASNLDSANEAARKWLHEAAGHQGVETVLGDKANDFLDGVYQAYKDRPMMDDLRRRYTNADNRTLAREVLAHLAEDPTSDPGLWRKVVAKVRAALRAAGVKLSVTDADIQEILRRAVKQIGGTQEQATKFASGHFEASNATITAPWSKAPDFAIAAHHGTPHKVDRFSTDKIGTGEGHQAYGWGLYFAEHPKVAEEYANRLGSAPKDQRLTLDGQEWEAAREGLSSDDWRAWPEVEGRARWWNPDKVDPLKKVETELRQTVKNYEQHKANKTSFSGDYLRDHEAAENAKRALAFIEKNRGSLKVEKATPGGGNKYTVNLDANPDELLDWDKPISEQSPTVRKAISDLAVKSEFDRMGKPYTGADFYRAYARAQGSESAASDWLARKGIKGVQFLDQMSRQVPNIAQIEFNIAEAKQRRAAWEREPSVSGHTTETTNNMRASYDTELRDLELQLIRAKQAASPTHNFVIFNDKDIRITHENGQEVHPSDVVPSEQGAPARFAAGNRGTFDETNPDIRFAAGEPEAGFDDLKAAAVTANARRGRAYEAINKARDVSNKDVTKEMQDERRAADIAAREASERLRRHPGYIEDTITRYNEALKKLEAAKAVKDPDALALARQAVEDFHHEFEQMPSRTFTQVWNRMQDEGKLPKSAEMPPGRSLSSLTDWLRAHDIESPKLGIIERMRLAARAGEFVKGLRDHASITGTKAKASWEAMKESFIHPPVDTDFRRVIKEWHFADTFTGQETHNWIKAIEAKVPDPRRRAAISVWLEARGDEDELRAQRADLNGVKNGQRYSGIWDLALKLTPSERALADSIHADFESKLDDAKNVGMLDKGRENYGVPQLWKVHPQPKEGTGFGDKQRAGNWRAQLDPRDPFFSLQRTVPTYFDGIMAGGEPHTLDVGKLVGVYNEAFHKNLSSRAVIWSLKDAKAADGMPVVKISGSAHFLPLESGKRQLLVDSATRGPDTVTADGRPYRSIDHWALRGWTYKGNTEAGSPVLVKGDFLVHPDHYEFLKNELLPSPVREGLPGKVFNPIFKTQAFLKASKFTMGTFHMFTVGEHMVTHFVNPFTNGFKIDLRDPDQARLVRNGLELGFSRERVAFEEGLASGHGGLWAHVPGIGQATSNLTDWLFKEYIPAIKMKVGLTVMKRNDARYGKELTPDQIAELSAHQMNAAGGMQAYRLLGSNKVLMDLNRLFLTAPDFLVSRFKVVGQALKPYGAEQRRFLITQAAIMYVGCRVLNEMLDGSPHLEPENVFRVVYHGRAYSIRTIVGDMAHLFSDPRGFAAGRLSPGVRTGIEVATDRDMRTGARKDTFFQWQPARGAEIAIRDLAMWLSPVGTEGMLPGSTAREQTMPETVASATVGLGSQKYNAQGQMWDAGAKFNRNSPDPAARNYQKERDAEARGESMYRKLDDLLLADKFDAAKKEYDALVQDGHKPSAIAARYKATNQDGDPTRPFTGKQERDKQMLAQQPELRRLYNEAIQERQELEAKFNRLPK